MKRHFASKRLSGRARVLALVAALAGALAVAGCAGGARQTEAAGGVEVVRVWPEYRTAESFDRISEYFTGRENTGGQIILRTRPESCTGYYFFTRIKTPAAITGARLVLEVIMPSSADPRTFTLEVPPLRKGVALLNPGLTGKDWPDAATRPNAWRMRLLAADGSELFARQSYLWSK